MFCIFKMGIQEVLILNFMIIRPTFVLINIKYNLVLCGYHFYISSIYSLEELTHCINNLKWTRCRPLSIFYEDFIKLLDFVLPSTLSEYWSIYFCHKGNQNYKIVILNVLMLYVGKQNYRERMWSGSPIISAGEGGEKGNTLNIVLRRFYPICVRQCLIGGYMISKEGGANTGLPQLSRPERATTFLTNGRATQ